MGWWNAGEDGSSLHEQSTGLLWGDGPADIIDDAIDAIVREFTEAWGRKPSLKELTAGIQFSLAGYEDDGEPDDGNHPQWELNVLTPADVSASAGNQHDFTEPGN